MLLFKNIFIFLFFFSRKLQIGFWKSNSFFPCCYWYNKWWKIGRNIENSSQSPLLQLTSHRFDRRKRKFNTVCWLIHKWHHTNWTYTQIHTRIHARTHIRMHVHNHTIVSWYRWIKWNSLWDDYESVCTVGYTVVLLLPMYTWHIVRIQMPHQIVEYTHVLSLSFYYGRTIQNRNSDIITKLSNYYLIFSF